MHLVWVSVLLAVTGSVWASCNAILPDTDFVANDLDSVSADSAENCCAPCQSNPLCMGFAVADGVCYLKFGQLTRIAKAGVSAATTRPSQCLPWETNNPNITTPGECCDECAANPACKLDVVSAFGCTLKSGGTDRRPNQDPSWNVRAAYVRPSLHPACKLYVASIHGCSLKSSGDKPRPNQNPAWNVTAAFINASVGNSATAAFVDATYSPDVRVVPVAFTTVAGSQWIPASQYESTPDDLQALVKALKISLAKHKHGVQPEMLITPLSDGSLVLPFTSVASVGECAALVKSHDQTFFTFLADASICLAHEFTSRNASYRQRRRRQGVQHGLGQLHPRDAQGVERQGLHCAMQSRRQLRRRTQEQQVLLEAKNISNIDMNAQDPLGEQPDHDMHLATGALVSEIVSESATWNLCVPQKYFYDCQTWYDVVNVAPVVEKLQRYAWLRLSQAIYAFDASVLFWTEHSANLGRTYIRRTINATAGGTC
ncbi:hypothetical protein AC1031_013546 [Aphanomyces cochlioides]|nr:hypothetical protein AC1031_013546 [Aphanomyces cochlioides]